MKAVEKKQVGAKPLYPKDKQPRQMNVRFVEAKDHRKIKELERELLNKHKVK
jgi:hypothetical protein